MLTKTIPCCPKGFKQTPCATTGLPGKHGVGYNRVSCFLAVKPVITKTSSSDTTDFDVVIIGAGFAGMYLLHRLRALNFTARVYEAGNDVGGTWYWNRYPGARCDVESVQYSYQFDRDLEQEWTWTERYSSQPEILTYAQHVADRFDLRRDITFDTRVVSAHFDEEKGVWSVETDRGNSVAATFCIMATGCLSLSNTPDFEGIQSFGGETYHTGRWPHEGVDFTNLRVGVIGTGSSAIQSIPEIAKQARTLTVFQRTANYSIPAHNARLSAEYIRKIKEDYPNLRKRARSKPAGYDMHLNPEPVLEASREEYHAEYEARWKVGGLQFLGAFGDLLLDPEANRTAADFVRDKIREIVADPDVAELLCPTNIIGCKRLCVDSGYYATYNLPHVSLVDVSSEPIERLIPTGLLHDGQEYSFDAIVFATGFDAMTGALLDIDIRGRDSLALRARWADGPQTYLGLTTHGFPNLFMVTGPGSPSVLTNMLPSIEQHVEFITDCLDDMRKKKRRRIEPKLNAEGKLVRACQRGRRTFTTTDLRFLVCGRERTRKAAGIHALYRGTSALYRTL